MRRDVHDNHRFALRFIHRAGSATGPGCGAAGGVLAESLLCWLVLTHYDDPGETGYNAVQAALIVAAVQLLHRLRWTRRRWRYLLQAAAELLIAAQTRKAAVLVLRR